MKIETLIKRWNKDWEEQKKKEINELYNALATVISERKPSIENLLAALKLIELGIIEKKLKEIQETK